MAAFWAASSWFSEMEAWVSASFAIALPVAPLTPVCVELDATLSPDPYDQTVAQSVVEVMNAIICATSAMPLLAWSNALLLTPMA